MDRDTLDYTLRKRLAGLVHRLDGLGTTDLAPDQRLTVALAIAEARQILASFERAVPDEPAPVTTPVFDTPPTVLVVDDNPTNTALLVAMLATMGVEAVSADQGTEALAQFETTAFDLVFMDVMLPGDDGIEVTRQIRARHGSQPYIVGLSALPGAQSRCLDQGMNAFVAKPVHLADVSGAIEECLAAGRVAS